MRIVLTEAAEGDLAAIYTHYAGRSGPTAGQVLGAILRAINGLALFPLIGRPGSVPQTRERIVMRYSYRIVYYVDEANEVIEVWRVLHGAQQWPPTE
ncbi:MAG TPA: type II toxin-antitoxin system RelE/ParE family toxin [Chloroflexota bacterium]